MTSQGPLMSTTVRFIHREGVNVERLAFLLMQISKLNSHPTEFVLQMDVGDPLLFNGEVDTQ